MSTPRPKKTPSLTLVRGGSAPRRAREERPSESRPDIADELRRLDAEVRELQQLLGRKTFEVEMLREALEQARRAGFRFRVQGLPQKTA